MNHLTKRCGCGKIFTLPNLKSRETRCGACLRPALAFGPAQIQHALTCLFLFASELAFRGHHRKLDCARQRAKRTPSWAGLDPGFDSESNRGVHKLKWIPAEQHVRGLVQDLKEHNASDGTRVLIALYGEKQYGVAYTTRPSLTDPDAALRRARAFEELYAAIVKPVKALSEPSSGSAADICRAIRSIPGVVGLDLRVESPGHFSAVVTAEASVSEARIQNAIDDSRPMGVSYSVNFVACAARPVAYGEALHDALSGQCLNVKTGRVSATTFVARGEIRAGDPVYVVSQNEVTSGAPCRQTGLGL